MRFLTRKIVQPNDLNFGDTLYGGRCLEWIDQEAAIYAMTETKHNRVATRKISEINFLAPAKQGDIVEIGVELKRVGITSVTLNVKVRNLRTQQIIVEIDEMVFVCLDENGKPEQHSLSKKSNEKA